MEWSTGNMRQLLRLPVNSFVYPIAAVSALQRSPRSSTGICISAIFSSLLFFALITTAMKRAIEREREMSDKCFCFSSYDPVKEEHPPPEIIREMKCLHIIKQTIEKWRKIYTLLLILCSDYQLFIWLVLFFSTLIIRLHSIIRRLQRKMFKKPWYYNNGTLWSRLL